MAFDLDAGKLQSVMESTGYQIGLWDGGDFGKISRNDTAVSAYRATDSTPGRLGDRMVARPKVPKLPVGAKLTDRHLMTGNGKGGVYKSSKIMTDGFLTQVRDAYVYVYVWVVYT